MARAIGDPAVAGAGATAAPADPRAGATRATDHANPVHRSSRRHNLTPAVDRARRDVDRRPRRSSSRMLEIGSVVIPINPPPVFVAIRELGPTLTWVGLVLLAIGAASAALLIFRPAHRRLRTLEHAARALGEGRTDVRAVEGGRRRSQRACDRVQPDGRRPRRARRGTGGVRPRAAPTARRRVARADDAARRRSRVHRNAGDARAQSRRADAKPLSRHHR